MTEQDIKADLITGIGNRALKNGELDAARELYQQASTLNPSSDYPVVWLSHVDQVAENTEGQIEHLTAAIQLNPKNSLNYQELADVYRYQGRYEEAIHFYTKAIELREERIRLYGSEGVADQLGFTDAYYSRGISYKELANGDAALADITKAIELDPTNDLYYRGRASVYENLLGRLDLAEADYLEAIHLNSESSLSYWNLGWLYIRLNRYVESIAATKKAMEFAPAEWLGSLYDNLGEALYRSGEYREAVEAYTHAIDSGFEGEPHYHRGLAYNALGDSQKAREDLSIASQHGFIPPENDLASPEAKVLDTKGEGRGALTATPIIDGETGTLTLSLEYPGPFNSLSLNRISYSPKHEFHITVIGFGHRFVQTLQSTRGIDKKAARVLSEQLLAEATKGLSLQVHRTGEYRILEKVYDGQVRRSVVELVQVEGLEDIYHRLEEASGIALSRIPAHVTLFVSGDQRGIGVNSQAELDQVGKLPDASGSSAISLALVPRQVAQLPIDNLEEGLMATLIQSLHETDHQSREGIRRKIIELANAKITVPGLPFTLSRGYSDQEVTLLYAADRNEFADTSEGKGVWKSEGLRFIESETKGVGAGLAHLLKHGDEFDEFGGIYKVLTERLPNLKPELSLRSRGAVLHLYQLDQTDEGLDVFAVVIVDPQGNLITTYTTRGGSVEDFGKKKSLITSVESLLNGEDASLLASVSQPETLYIKPNYAESQYPNGSDVYVKYTRNGKTLDISFVRMPHNATLGEGFKEIGPTKDGREEKKLLSALYKGVAVVRLNPIDIIPLSRQTSFQRLLKSVYDRAFRDYPQLEYGLKQRLQNQKQSHLGDTSDKTLIRILKAFYKYLKGRKDIDDAKVQAILRGVLLHDIGKGEFMVLDAELPIGMNISKEATTESAQLGTHAPLYLDSSDRLLFAPLAFGRGKVGMAMNGELLLNGKVIRNNKGHPVMVRQVSNESMATHVLIDGASLPLADHDGHYYRIITASNISSESRPVKSVRLKGEMRAIADVPREGVPQMAAQLGDIVVLNAAGEEEILRLQDYFGHKPSPAEKARLLDQILSNGLINRYIQDGSTPVSINDLNGMTVRGQNLKESDFIGHKAIDVEVTVQQVDVTGIGFRFPERKGEHHLSPEEPPEVRALVGGHNAFMLLANHVRTLLSQGESKISTGEMRGIEKTIQRLVDETSAAGIDFDMLLTFVEIKFAAGAGMQQNDTRSLDEIQRELLEQNKPIFDWIRQKKTEIVNRRINESSQNIIMTPVVIAHILSLVHENEALAPFEDNIRNELTKVEGAAFSMNLLQPLGSLLGSNMKALRQIIKTISDLHQQLQRGELVQLKNGSYVFLARNGQPVLLDKETIEHIQERHQASATIPGSRIYASETLINLIKTVIEHSDGYGLKYWDFDRAIGTDNLVSRAEIEQVMGLSFEDALSRGWVRIIEGQGVDSSAPNFNPRAGRYEVAFESLPEELRSRVVAQPTHGLNVVLGSVPQSATAFPGAGEVLAAWENVQAETGISDISRGIGLVTVFPGKSAPKFPESPRIVDEAERSEATSFWANHIFANMSPPEGATSPDTKRAMNAGEMMLLGKFRLAWDLWRGEHFTTLSHYLNDVPAQVAVAEKAAGRHFERLAQAAEAAGHVDEAQRLRAVRVTVRADAEAVRGQGGLMESIYQEGQLAEVIITINPHLKARTIEVAITHELVHLEREDQFQESLSKLIGRLGKFLGTLVARIIEEIATNRETNRRLRHTQDFTVQSLPAAAQKARTGAPAVETDVQDRALNDNLTAMIPTSNHSWLASFMETLHRQRQYIIAGGRAIGSAA